MLRADSRQLRARSSRLEAQSSMLSDTAILTHIARQPKRQAGYKQLVRELGLHGEERRDLNDHLQTLIKRGALIPIDSDRYALPQAAADKNLCFVCRSRPGYDTRYSSYSTPGPGITWPVATKTDWVSHWYRSSPVSNRGVTRK